MISENLMGKHVPDIVGAIFRRIGRTVQAQATVPERFVLGGRVKHVAITRRTFVVEDDGRHYCLSWDDETKFVGTTVFGMHGTEVIVNARANIVGLHAESIAIVGHVEGSSADHDLI